MFSIIGIVVVFGCVVAGYLMEHGNLKVLMQPAELIIILGAAIGTVLIANPLYILTKIGAGLGGAFGGSAFDKQRYLCSMRMRPMEALGLLQMDLAVAFPIMDLVLGGLGTSTVEIRELTEIEEQILESVMRILTRELQASWAIVLPVEIEFEQRQQTSQTQVLMAATERCLALNFEVRMTDARGMLNVTLSPVASNALLRKLSAQNVYSDRKSSATHVKQIQDHLLDGNFLVDLRLPPIPLRVGELTDLEVGQILPLQQPVEKPAVLYVAERDMFSVFPVACGRLRGAQVLHTNSIVPVSRKADV